MVGTLSEKGERSLVQVGCGTARSEATDAPEYYLGTGLGTPTPILTHIRTGRVFTLSWHDIIALAEEAGIAD